MAMAFRETLIVVCALLVSELCCRNSPQTLQQQLLKFMNFLTTTNSETDDVKDGPLISMTYWTVLCLSTLLAMRPWDLHLLFFGVSYLASLCLVNLDPEQLTVATLMGLGTVLFPWRDLSTSLDRLMVGCVLVLPRLRALTGYTDFLVIAQLCLIAVVSTSVRPIPSISLAVYVARNIEWRAVLRYLWFDVIKVSALLERHFIVFWCVIVSAQLFHFLNNYDLTFLAENWFDVLFSCVLHCSVTPFGIIGFGTTSAYVSRCIENLTRAILQKQNRCTCCPLDWGLCLCLICCGITGLLTPEVQGALVLVMLLIVVFWTLDSMFEVTNSVLIALNAIHEKSVLKHARAMIVCAFLCIVPIYMFPFVSMLLGSDFYLFMMVPLFTLAVKVLGSLVTYGICLYDTFQKTPWENADDIAYNVNVTFRVLDSLLVLYSVLLNAKEAIVRMSWMGIIASSIFSYARIWDPLQSTWKDHLLRRNAERKIAPFPEATSQQLARHNNICSLCLHELRTAKINNCGHFFHHTCLRKLVQVQDNCPMCLEHLDFSLEDVTIEV